MYSSVRASASWPAFLTTALKAGENSTVTLAPLTVGRASTAAWAAARSCAGFAPARSTIGCTTPSGWSSRQSSRCSGSTSWFPRVSARAWAAPSASAARSVGLSTGINWTSSGLVNQWRGAPGGAPRELPS